MDRHGEWHRVEQRQIERRLWQGQIGEHVVTHTTERDSAVKKRTSPDPPPTQATSLPTSVGATSESKSNSPENPVPFGITELMSDESNENPILPENPQLIGAERAVMGDNGRGRLATRAPDIEIPLVFAVRVAGVRIHYRTRRVDRELAKVVSFLPARSGKGCWPSQNAAPTLNFPHPLPIYPNRSDASSPVPQRRAACR